MRNIESWGFFGWSLLENLHLHCKNVSSILIDRIVPRLTLDSIFWSLGFAGGYVDEGRWKVLDFPHNQSAKPVILISRWADEAHSASFHLEVRVSDSTID